MATMMGDYNSSNKRSVCFLLLLLFSFLISFPVSAQQAQQPEAEEKGIMRFFDKIGHWLVAYGISSEDFLQDQRKQFKNEAFAQVYIQGIIDFDQWLFNRLNRVTELRYEAKQNPHLLFDVKFKPLDNNLNRYQVLLSLQTSSAVSVDLSRIANDATAKHLKGKTYAEPVEALTDVENAIAEALRHAASRLGKALAPNLMVRHNNEVFWKDQEIPILAEDGNFIELEAINKNGERLKPSEIRWTNADPFESKGVVDMTGIASKQVTLTWNQESMTVTLKRAMPGADINELLKALLIELLTAKKQQAKDTLVLLRQDSLANAQNLARQLALLESRNFPMEARGGTLTPVFASPVTLTDSSEFLRKQEHKQSFELLKKRKRIRSTIRRKVNVVAFADLVVDQPDKIQVLLDELLRNSGRLIARLALNRDSQGQRETARNIVVDFLNQHLERIAGRYYGPEPAMPPLQPAVVPNAAPPFNPNQYLYISENAFFNGKEDFKRELEEYLKQLPEPLYVFVNYSQDISTETYLARVQGTRPEGLPEGARYVVFTVVNIPGSVQEQLVVSAEGAVQVKMQPKGVREEMWEMVHDPATMMNWIREDSESAMVATLDEAALERIASNVLVGDFILETNYAYPDGISPADEYIYIKGFDVLFQLLEKDNLRVIAFEDKGKSKIYFWDDKIRWYKANDGYEYDNYWANDLLNAGITVVRPMAMLAGADPKGRESLKVAYENYNGTLIGFVGKLAKDGIVELVDDIGGTNGSYRQNQALLGIWMGNSFATPSLGLASTLSKNLLKIGIKVGGKTLKAWTFATLLNIEIFRYSLENGQFVFINSLRSTANAVVVYTIRDIRYVTDVNPTVKLGTVELVKDAAGNIFWRELVSTTLSWVDNIYTSQKNLVNQFKNTIATATNLRKGNFGEMASDVLLSEKGYRPLHNRIIDIDAPTKQGIDGVFKKGNEYFIVEAKYKGSATLGSTADGKQMSDGWIRGSNRLLEAVGKETTQEIINSGYKRILAEVAPDGSIIFKELDGSASVIGTFIP